MDDEFRELTRQLEELSETINRFESEAVQLRIVELFFEERAQQLGHLSEGETVSYVSGPGQLGRAGERGSRPSGKQAAKGPSASGAVAVLEKLVKGDFFDERRTIRDVVKASEERFGAQYRANAFSGPLSRYAKKGALKREKNGEGKYVYFK